MVDTGFIEATDKIVLAGSPITVEKEIETVATMYPGRLVIRDTGDNQVEVAATDDLVYGWLAYEHTPVMYRPATKDTIYSVNDRAAVIVGGDIIIRGKLTTSQTIVMGDKLTVAAAGTLTKATIGTHMVVATAMESVTTTTAEANIIVKSRL